jgi:hypothetical protein
MQGRKPGGDAQIVALTIAVAGLVAFVISRSSPLSHNAPYAQVLCPMVLTLLMLGVLYRRR